MIRKAQEDIEAAQCMLKSEKYGWALSIAYNSMLSCGQALMAKAGFWPTNESHHLTVIA
jgi:uncharacterized protein (UPF0332 family)